MKGSMKLQNTTINIPKNAYFRFTTQKLEV